jgi:hypothetical protein
MSTSASRHRVRRAFAVACIALSASLATTGCTTSIGWKLGKTHGAIIEPTARRASLGIYRAPSRSLYSVYARSGTRAAQDVLWALGAPPVASVSVDGIGVSTTVLNRKMHGYLYGDAADFRGALIDAHRRDDCLALTLISQGLYIKNWTHKDVGCRTGAVR